jgi:hypothetical protein
MEWKSFSSGSISISISLSYLPNGNPTMSYGDNQYGGGASNSYY